jgi:hypothetical protein
MLEHIACDDCGMIKKKKKKKKKQKKKKRRKTDDWMGCSIVTY